MKRVFRPVFINRIDQSVIFRALGATDIRQIVNLELDDLRTNLKTKEMKLEVTDALLDHLGEAGFDPVFGARPLRRVIQNLIEDKLSDQVLGGTFEPGDTVKVDITDGEVNFTRLVGEVTSEEPALTTTP